MKEKEFLKKLESKLSSLDEEKRSKIIKKYEKIIDDEIESGKEEKDVIASLGDIDLIVKLNIDNENKKEATKEDKETDDVHYESSIDKGINSVLKYIDDAFTNVNEQLAKRILVILCFIAIGMLALSLLHIPFRIIDIMGQGIFNIVFNDYYFYHVVSTFWSLSINICYAIIVIWLIVHYINQIVVHYSNDIDFKKYKYHKSKIEETKKEVREEHTSSKDVSPFDIVYLILKIFVILMTIPFILLEVALFIALFASIALIINGVVMYGPLIFLIGLIFLIATLINLIYMSISKGGIR